MALKYLPLRLMILSGLLLSVACSESRIQQKRTLSFSEPRQATIEKGPLLATHFSSLEDLSANIDITYKKSSNFSTFFGQESSSVHLIHEGYGKEVTSILEAGLDEKDITDARDGGILSQLELVISSPRFARNRQDMLRVYLLARRDFKTFGEGDAAFYDLAERMLYNIDEDDLALISSSDLSEKGYLNTFNHITAQTFMTLLFSEDLADLVADIHERTNMVELITGAFTEAQLADLETGPVDNYVDMINNEWGQELGKALKAKYNISRATIWTSELLTDVLNDIQAYYSWAFQMGFKPFQPTDEKIIRFSFKLNKVMRELSSLS